MARACTTPGVLGVDSAVDLVIISLISASTAPRSPRLLLRNANSSHPVLAIDLAGCVQALDGGGELNLGNVALALHL